MLRKGRKFWKRACPVMLASIMAGNILLGGSMMTEASEIDITSYEHLDELYGDYFKFGAACEAIDH